MLILNVELRPSVEVSASSLFNMSLLNTFSSSDEYFNLVGDLNFKALNPNCILAVGEGNGSVEEQLSAVAVPWLGTTGSNSKTKLN